MLKRAITISSTAVATGGWVQLGIANSKGTNIITLNSEWEKMSLQIASATQTVNHFKIEAQFYPGGAFESWLSDSDFATVTDTLGNFGTAYPFTAITAGNTAWLRDLDVTGVNALKLWAQSSAGTATVTGGGTLTANQ